MPVQTLESLRLLTNLETEKRKLIQVVLFGQPELDTLLDHPSVRQLKQRITYSYQLLPLNKVACMTYIRHRLTIAGYLENKLFTRRAFDMVYKQSKGVPRLINILCHKALISAYGEGKKQVTHKHVMAAARDMEQPKKHSGSWFKESFFSRWLIGT